MKRTHILLLIILSLCALTSGLHAQPKNNWPKTLLWRISGNGLSKNSYLYGTMHLQDKRLFYFSDSLYHYLEQAEGYALEINMQDFMDSMMQRMIEQRAEDIILDKHRLEQPDEKQKIIDSLINNVKTNNDKASRKQLKKLRDEKMQKALKNKEMPTIMDAYLYGIAKRMGKWLGGIEDVQDQLVISDELGADVSEEELLEPETQLSASIEQMIQTYLAKNLDAIEVISENSFSDRMEDMIFLKRNIKMARRMDSLAHIRSMFFTVGAAHLPGDSGVIKLLRQRGYKVEPVFSQTVVDPAKYASRLAQVPWIKNEQKTYEVEMPGKAYDIDLFGDLFKMKFYMDITTFRYFMTGSTIASKDLDLEKAMQGFITNTGSELKSKKLITKEGVKGIEAVFAMDDSYCKLQFLVKNNRLYMLIAGGQKKDVTESNDLKKFFNSFIIHENVQQPETQWSVFPLKEKGMMVELPGIPKQNEKLEKTAEGTSWAFTVYDYVDINSGLYYIIQVRDIEPGYYLPTDTAFFSLFRNRLTDTTKRITKDSLYTLNNFPALSLDGEIKGTGMIFKTLAITRGNRVYDLIVAGVDNAASDMDRFLHSLKFYDYQKSEWEKQDVAAGNFQTVAPAPIKLKPEENNNKPQSEEEKQLNYISYNPINCISYHVIKRNLPAYYWTTSDTAYFDKIANGMKGENDSVVYANWVTNGNLKGKEWVLSVPGSTNLKKIRLLLNGDTLYTLLSFIPSMYINEKEHQLFFDEFRVIHENLQPTISKSKAEKLLADLSSTDSTTNKKASNALDYVVFTKRDLPFLHEALVKIYPTDSSDDYNYSTRHRIVGILKDIADSSTVDFVKANFNHPNTDKPEQSIQFDMLDLLARYKTAYSYSTLKDLLLNHTPTKKRDNDNLSYRLTDSLELTMQIFSDIIKLSNNNLFAERLIDITSRLLDSNLVTKNMLLPYEKNFLYTADTTYKAIKNPGEDFWGYSYTPIPNVISIFNDAECNKLLQKYLTLDDLDLKESAALGLLKNKQVVDKTQLEKIAASISFRREFYDKLVKLDKQQFFPSKYLTQQSLAESDMYIYTYDDVQPRISFIDTKTVEYKGTQKRFYLFRIKFPSEEGEESTENEYLGITGPYFIDKKNMTTENEATGWYYKESFDPKKIDEQFEELLGIRN